MDDIKQQLQSEIEALTNSLENISNNILAFKDTSTLMLKVESINKIRRFGEKEYLRRYANNHSKLVSSNMKVFTYLRDMEIVLINFKNDVVKQLDDLKIKMMLLDNE